jgi:hypothetical protein
MSNLRLGRIAAVLAAAFVVGAPVAALVLSSTLSRAPVPMHIRWKAGTNATDRVDLERRFHLLDGVYTERNTWAYHLADPSTDNIRAIVQHPAVEDTEDLNRIRFRPRFSYDRERRLVFFSIIGGGVVAIGLLATLLMSNPGWFMTVRAK